MRTRGSQARRRRLIQGGLLGTGASADQESSAEDEYEQFLDSDSEYEIDQATAAVLSTELNSQLVDTISVQPTKHAGLAAIQSLIRGRRDVRWVFSGDNIIQGAFSTLGARSCVELFSERIRAELRRAGDVVINTGVMGDTTRQLLATLNRRVLRYRPDVVGLSIGLNDAKHGVSSRNRFRRHVREVLDRIRTAGSIPLLILPHPIYLPAVSNRDDLPQYVEILREESVRDEVPYVDQWQDWMEHWPDPEATRERLFDERIQLNGAAHQHLAALIFRTLGIYDPDSIACGVFQ